MRAFFSMIIISMSGALSCTGQGQAQLAITLGKQSPVSVRLTATNGDGTVGAGEVRVTTEAGSLTSGESLTLDEYGTAATSFTCDSSTESACAGPVRVSAAWQPRSGPSVKVDAQLHPGATVNSSISGGSTSGPRRLVSRCPDQNALNATGGCCFDQRAPTCGAYLVHDGDSFTMTYVDAATNAAHDFPLRFHLPPVASLDACKQASYGFEVDLSSVDGGVYAQESVSCAGGYIASTGEWLTGASGACPAMMSDGVLFDCDLVWDPTKHLDGTWSQSTITESPLSDVYAGSRRFVVRAKTPMPAFIAVLKRASP